MDDRIRVWTAALWLAPALLAACDRDRPPQPARSLPQLQQGNGRIHWQGLRACADCDGIQTALTLQRGAGGRNYTLIETYLAEGDGARFVETGNWRTESDLLRLQGDGGGARVFAVLPDGSLQPRDGRGRNFSPSEDDVLVPVTAQDTP